MVTRREFNRIKKESPNSRIGKREWIEQKIRNDAFKIIRDARRKGVKTPYESYVDRIYREKSKYSEAVNENMSLKEENMELQKQESANMKLKNLSINRDKFIKGFPFGLVDKMRNDESLILALKGLIELARILEYRNGWAFTNSEFDIKGFEKLVTNKEEYLNNIKYARSLISNIFEKYKLNKYLPELFEDFENYFDMKEEICQCEKEEELNKYGGKYSDTLFKLPGKVRKAYAELLNPIIVEIGKIIADDCPASAKKTIGEYIARSGLLPVFWYKGKEDKSSRILNDSWIPAGTGLYDYRYNCRALRSSSEIKPVLNILDLCGVYYKYRYEEGDFQIDIGDSQEAPIPGGSFMKYEIDSKDILSNNIELIKNINELKHADLVLVYRNNQTYSGLSDELKKMIKYQYGGNVSCVTFSKDIDDLDEFGKDRLKMLLTSCNCLTDDTVSKWAGIQTQKIEDIIDNTMTDRLMNTFTVEINELKSKLLSRGIQDVYIPTDNITDHGYIKKVNDGSFKYDYHGGSIQDRYDFRLEMFKDSGIKLHFGNYDSDTNKTAIICDRHCSNEISRGFKYRIEFAGNYFEPNKGFDIGSGKGGGFSKGELIAHKLFE